MSAPATTSAPAIAPVTTSTTVTAPLERAPRVLAIMLTRRCDIACGHCSVVSGPDVPDRASEGDLLAAVRDAAAAGVGSVQLTGGEPMLREELVLAMLREARRAGIRVTMTTNASFGATPEDARRRLRALVGAGLHALTVSYDRWHEQHLGPEPVLNVVRAAEEIAFPVQVNVVRGADDREVGALAERVAGFANVKLRFYDAQPVGRAKAIGNAELRGETAGFCRTAWFPALTDDGRVIACNGPAYFAKPTSPLVIGSTRDEPLRDLVDRHQSDPLLRAIQAFGPERLRAELRRIPGRERFELRERYAGMCDLCLHLTSEPAIAAALREHFAEPRLAAETAAMLRLIDESRAAGTLGTAHANGPGSARIFFAAARSGASTVLPGAGRILGRSDLDWKRKSALLVACGLARPLIPLVDGGGVARWAPRFFVDELRRAATRAAMMDLIKIEALERLDRALAELGAPGVLLKGSAVLAATAPAERGRLRSTGDVDVVVGGGAARRLRAYLLASGDGFRGDPDAQRSAAHHLAPVSFRGVPIEIHERILPRTFGMPEDEMLARATPIAGSRALHMLDGAGFALHALVHCAADTFSFGPKAAWDVAWALDRAPDLDWARVVRWAEASSLPRAFWTPLRALAGELDLAVPPDVVAAAPRDRRQRALDAIARARIFIACDGPFDLNPFSKTAVALLLCDSWRGRAAYLAEIAHGEAAEARRRARRHAPAQSLRRLPQQLREAAVHWRAFRVAMAPRD